MWVVERLELGTGLQMARHELQSTKRSHHMKKIVAVLLIAAAMPAVAEVRCKPFPLDRARPGAHHHI